MDSSQQDQEQPLDPAAMLELVAEQQRSVEARMGAAVPATLASWGIAWFVGFGAFWLVDALAPGFQLPVPLATTVFAVLLLGAIGVSAWLGVRSGRGIRSTPNAAFEGAVYGVTWWIGSLGIAGLGWGLGVNGMSPELATFFYSSSYVIFAGIMFIAAGVVWHAMPSVVLGAWTVAVGAVAPFFGYPGNFLFLAIAGGGAFFVLAVAGAVHLRRLDGAARAGR